VTSSVLLGLTELDIVFSNYEFGEEQPPPQHAVPLE
jgi:hypothetical protein